MPAEITFVLITAVVVALIGLAALVAAWRDRGVPRGDVGDGARERPDGGRAAASDGAGNAMGRPGGTAYGAAIRILWWISIASVLVGIGITDAFRSTQPAIYGLGAAAVIVAVVLHDLLPRRWRTPSVIALEVLAALALVTSLLALTGYGASPFAYAYSMVAVAVALALGPRVALAVAALATLSYLGVLALDPSLPEASGTDLLRYGLSIGSIWLLAFLAGAFALGARRDRERARTDPLTGLMNRSELRPMLEQEVQRTRRSERGFCLLMLDLDGLKAVNDTHGHHRGDEVLQALGGVISHSIRTVDTAFRFGGDEFLVILPETDFTGAFVVAEKIRGGAEEVGLGSRGRELPTSVSIGLVSCPEDGSGADELMRAVDRAMYQAKSMGKNQISGNPQPRRLLGRSTTAPAEAPAAAEAVPPPPAVAATPAEPVAASRPAATATMAPAAEARTPVLHAANGAQGGDDEPDPSDVRRHIAAARLHMDPDHQIRRAMDAFLSPSGAEDR